MRRAMALGLAIVLLAPAAARAQATGAIAEIGRAHV